MSTGISLEDIFEATQYQAVQLKKIAQTQEHIETDMAYDRSRIENLEVRISGLEAQMKILVERTPRLETRLRDAVAAAVAPLNEQMNSLMIRANKNKIQPKPRVSFWRRLFRREPKE